MVKMVNKDLEVQDVTPKANADTMAGLDALAGLAQAHESAGEAENQASQDKQAKKETDTLAADLLDTLGMCAGMAEPALWWLSPAEFDRLWGAKVQKAVAESGAAIMRRHGLSLGDLMSQYGPYIALAGALGPSTLATVQSFKRAKLQLAHEQKAAPSVNAS